MQFSKRLVSPVPIQVGGGRLGLRIRVFASSRTLRVGPTRMANDGQCNIALEFPARGQKRRWSAAKSQPWGLGAPGVPQEGAPPLLSMEISCWLGPESVLHHCCFDLSSIIQTFQELKEFVVNYKPFEEIKIPEVNILLIGPVDAGKSSFFNTH